jgi:type IV secretory pathway VirB2 component (pilin)
MGEFIKSSGGRKYILACVLIVGFFALGLAGKISYEQVISGVTWVFGIFAGANVAQKFSPTNESLPIE